MTLGENMAPGKKRKGVFLDRDGTLIREKGYLKDPGQLELERGAAEAVRLLNRAGIPVILVTNQSGIARGYYTERDLQAVHQNLCEMLADRDARLDAIYYCPHHPEGNDEAFRKRCGCRKPEFGMLRQAELELGIDLPGSFLVGDKRSDIQCARNGGMPGILVTTGYGREEWTEAMLTDPESGPDLVAGSLIEAVQRILEEDDSGSWAAEEKSRPPWRWKYTSLAHLKARLALHRENGRTVVFTNGVFDLFHPGHLGYLQAARDLGDILVVGVNDDVSTRALKGPQRPVFPVVDRVAILSALSCVDYCVVFRDRTVDRLLEAVRPDIHAKGTDYTEDSVPERETVERLGGKVMIVGPPRGRSTSEILRMLSGENDG